jgi:hypothetical protein
MKSGGVDIRTKIQIFSKILLFSTEAAQVAYEMMFQEDFSHGLTNCMSMYCCVKRLQDIGNVQPEEDPSAPEEVGGDILSFMFFIKAIHSPTNDGSVSY